MRKKLSKFIDEKTAKELIKLDGNKHLINSDVTPGIIMLIVHVLSQYFYFDVKDQSYWIVEKRPKGHEWHYDTGSANHMAWCEVGCSLLLTDDFTGGETYYRVGGSEVLCERGLYDLVAHTSDEEHMVAPHVGNRIVLLIFL